MMDGMTKRPQSQVRVRSFTFMFRFTETSRGNGRKDLLFFFLELFFVFSSFFGETHQKTLKKSGR